jgi:hypothetical protein
MLYFKGRVVVHGGVMTVVIAIEPKVLGFTSGRERSIFKGDKKFVAWLLSMGRGLKP